MLGIIGAMEIEVRHLVSLLENSKQHTVSGVSFFSGTLHGTPVVVGKCGAGKVNAAICAQLMITVFGADTIVNTGVAGGLASGMHQFDIIVATAFVQHDIDTTAVGDPLGFVSGLEQIELPADDTLSALLAECAAEHGNRVTTGIIATGDQFICSAQRSAAIAQTFGAGACDMEGGAIAQVCVLANVPLAALRCISDNADGSAGASYAEFAPAAAEICSRIVVDYAERIGKSK